MLEPLQSKLNYLQGRYSNYRDSGLFSEIEINQYQAIVQEKIDNIKLKIEENQ